MRRVLLGVVLVAAVAPWLVLATDAPHDASSTPTVQCSSCHKLHGAQGGSLTKEPNNFDLCSSCHNQTGVGLQYGFPWSSHDQAHPGASGIHHHWEGADANPLYGAQGANDVEVKKRLKDGLQCSACHDQHDAKPEYGGSQMRSAVTRITGAGTGKAEMVLGTVRVDATERGYLVKVSDTTPNAERFVLSNNAGVTWFGWTGTDWVEGAPDGRPIGAGAGGPGRNADIELNDGAFVQFTDGALAVGDSWRFYVSYAFLRVSNADDALCVDCHRPRYQSHLDVRGDAGGNLPEIVFGQTVFSHPVGVSLGSTPANSYDRTVGANGAPLDADGTETVLDANGKWVGAADGNRSNDLNFGAANKVWCYTCHRPHNADSNSLSEDK